MHPLRRAILTALPALLLGALVASSAFAADLRDILRAYGAGRYEDVITLTTEKLAERPQAAESYQYLRGMAALRIAWFGAAEEDFACLGDFSPGRGWPPAAEQAARIARSRELAPAHVHEVTAGNQVLFRVYYDVDDKWTRTLVEALREVHQRVSRFYGVTMVETAVFVFADRERHAGFIEALTGERLTSWQWASGGNGMLVFCPYMPGDGYRVSAGQLPETVAHEFSHCLTHRVLGTAAMPLWLDEGLAMHCASLFRPQKAEENDIFLTRLWTAERVLPLRAVTNRDTFYDESIAADAYVQAFAMVRYLISELGRDDLMVLLNALRHERRIEAAMDQMWTGGLPGFYQDWLAATEQRVEKFR